MDLVSRFLDHYRSCKRFITDREDESLYVDNRLLYMVIKSAYDDIERYKRYHLADPANDLSNSVKRSAYICKWICKLKPIQQHVNSVDLDIENINISEVDISELIESLNLNDASVLFINIDLALNLAQLYIGSELETPFHYMPHYYDEFSYDLLYRELNDDALLHIFQNIYSAVKVQRAGVLEFPNTPAQIESIFNS